MKKISIGLLLVAFEFITMNADTLTNSDKISTSSRFVLDNNKSPDSYSIKAKCVDTKSSKFLLSTMEYEQNATYS